MTDGLPAARFITASDILYPTCVNYGLHSDYEGCALLMFIYRVPYSSTMSTISPLLKKTKLMS